MDNPETYQFDIEVSASDATEEDIDSMTRQLLAELNSTEVESAELTKGSAAPEGSKGDPITLGSIAIAVLPAVLPNVLTVVQEWATRGRGRTVKFKGRGIEFEGSPEELQQLLFSLGARGPAKEKQPKEKKGAERKTKGEQTPARNRVARSSKVFISYRRADSADVTGRIYDRLIAHFGESAIFKDVNSIPPGFDFREYLEGAVGNCKIFLAVIGDQWLEASDSKKRNRLQDPDDFVRIEIESALKRNITIIPLLVRGAAMPAEAKLPPSLRKLIYRNAVSIRPDPDFHRDMDRLIEAISNIR